MTGLWFKQRIILTYSADFTSLRLTITQEVAGSTIRRSHRSIRCPPLSLQRQRSNSNRSSSDQHHTAYAGSGKALDTWALETYSSNDQILCLVQGPATVFHAPSLPLAFLSFFRSVSSDNLAEFLLHLASTPYPATVAHIYTIYLEDLGGTRASQVRARKRGTKGMSMEEIVALGPDLADGEEWGPLAPPSIGYLLHDLLLLTPAVSLGSKSTGNSVEKKGRDEAMVRMDMVKSALLVLMLDLFEIEHEGWTEVLQLGGEWEEGIKGSMENLQAEEALARIGILRDVLQDDSPTDDEGEEEEDTAEQHDEADEGHGGKDARAVKDFKGEGAATDGSGVKAQASASMLHLENDAGDDTEATEEIEEADEVDGTSERSRAEDES